MDTIYRERANGRWEYWVYSGSQRVYVSKRWAARQVQNRTARIVYVN